MSDKDRAPAGSAPSVTTEALNKVVKDVEIVTHVTKSGQTLRWAVLTTENGFAVTGKPSCCVSPENDDPVKGEQIAMANAEDELWALEGYLLKQRLYEKEQVND